MITLDVRTIVFVSTLLSVLAFSVIYLLWWQNHKKFSGLTFLVVDYALQAVAVFLVYLRGSIPDYISVTLPNCLALTGLLLLLAGLARFTGKNFSLLPGMIVLAVLILVQIYYSLIQPDLAYRSYILQTGSIIFAAQGVWLLWRSPDPGIHLVTRGPAFALILLVVVTAARLGVLFFSSHSNNDFFQSGSADMVFYVLQVLGILYLTFNLILMVNWRLIQQANRSESELKTRNTYIQTVLDNLPIGVAVNNFTDGKSIYLNPAFEKIYGWPAAKLISVEEFFDLVYVDPEYRAKTRSRVMADLASGDIARMKWEGLKITSSEGLNKTINAANIPLIEQNMMISTVQDITDRSKALEDLQASEERFRSTLENLFEGGQIIGFDWKYIYVNQMAVQQSHKTREELLGHTLQQVIPGIEHTPLFQVLSKCMLERVPGRYENEHVYESGGKAWFDLMIHPVKEGLFMLSLDITDRKIAEDALYESEEKYRTLYERMAQGVIYQNADGEVVSVNAAARRILNVSQAEIKNTQVIDANVKAIHEDGTEFLALDHPSMQALHTGQPVNDIIMGIWDTKTNSNKWIMVNAIPQFRPGESKPYQVFVTFDEVTAIKKAELMFKQSEDRLRLILNSAAEAIYGVDTGGNCTFCNPACLKLLGYRSETDLLGQNMQRLIHYRNAEGANFPQDDVLISQAVSEGKGSHFENDIFWKADGTSLPVEYWSYPQFRDGKVIGSVVTFIDITERRQAADRAIEIESLKQINKAKSELLANVSHELRTPLSSIKGFIETLLETDVEWSKDQQVDFLRSAVVEADRLTFLIRDLLDMSRLDSGRIALDKRNYSLDEILGTAANVISALTENHQLQYAVAADVPVIRADKIRIAQVLTNLVENATKFSPAGSVVTISVKNENDQVLFSVEDQGEGMTKEVLANLFNRFYQAERVVFGKTRGTGLGLAICKGIIESHGGTIWAESEPGKGSKFSFSLPNA